MWACARMIGRLGMRGMEHQQAVIRSNASCQAEWLEADQISCYLLCPTSAMLAQAHRHTAKEMDGARGTHSGSGRAGRGFSYDTITKPGLEGGGAALFLDVAGLKVAPTVFDGAHALGSALLIGACGGLTLLLRYCGTTFLD